MVITYSVAAPGRAPATAARRNGIAARRSPFVRTATSGKPPVNCGAASILLHRRERFRSLSRDREAQYVTSATTPMTSQGTSSPPLSRAKRTRCPTAGAPPSTSRAKVAVTTRTRGAPAPSRRVKRRPLSRRNRNVSK